ncbi:MAG: hypothetical protein K1Y02_01125 [Candidatus Hydrogenedentes bacterium]|nr:hypothetical protein [Candidatus Hydrogenedentota bacterium]
MRTILPALLTALVPFTAIGADTAPQTLDSVEQQIGEAWKKIESYTATLHLEGNIPKGIMTIAMKGSGPFEFMKIDGKPHYRSELTNTVDIGIPLPESMAQQNILTVFDGTTLYTQMSMAGRQKAAKRDPNSGTSRSPESGKEMFDSLRKKGDLTLLPDAEVDGKPVFVLEVKPKPEDQKDAPVTIAAIRVYVAKESGIQVKSEFLDAANKPFTTVHYTDIALNAKIDPSRFVYTPPKGVKVEDLTGGKPMDMTF